jgi:hypothetical protein
MKIIIHTLFIFCFFSCSTFKERDKKREIQSSTLRALNDKAPVFSECAKVTDIFTVLNKKRIRVELNLTLNSKGQVENFQLDNKQYPDKFVECLFQTIDLIIFPALEPNEIIQLVQPMIFSEK